MKLRVGITKILPEWELVLRQIGVPYKKLESKGNIREDDYSVIIVSSVVDDGMKKNIIGFLGSGGTILLEADIAGNLLGIELDSVKIKYLYPKNDSLFFDVHICDLGCTSLVGRKAQFLDNQEGKKTVMQMSVDKGIALILPAGFMKALLDTEIKRKNFLSTNGDRFPNERVSKVSKGSIRQVIYKSLVHLYHHRRLPFIHLWYFPNGNKSVFLFRVDTDFCKKEEAQNLYETLRLNRIRGTWFVETKSQQDWAGYYRKLENQEIGYHCYRHRVFSDYRMNKDDFQKGMQILENSDFFPTGYAAPYGEWNCVLAKVIQEQGFEYSTEFGIGYDNHPFFPYLGKDFSTVVQIPIHPISIGRLNRARMTEDQMLRYYRAVFDLKLDGYEPIIFYHHPSQGKTKIFDKIFKVVNTHDIPSLTFEDYASWWKTRDNVKWSAQIDNRGLLFESTNAEPSIWLRASLPSGADLLNPIAKVRDLNDWANKLVIKKDRCQFDPKLLRRYNWRMSIHDLESYYGKSKR